MKIILYTLLVISLAACHGGGSGSGSNHDTDANSPKILTYSIVNTYPHDTSSFTEGLLFYKGELFESTGEKGRSKLIQADLKTGKIIRSLPLDSKYFGEGIVIIRDTIYQLTYQEKVGFMYSLKDFKKLGEFSFAAPEGWGMTTDGKQIIATDGTSTLYFYQPGTFKLIKTQAVTEAGSFAFNLNELEYIDGFIYANQWQSPYIFKIDPVTGQIVAKIDLSATADSIRNRDPEADVLNGIAYDSTTHKMYVTGKKWPELYEIQLSK